MTTIKVFDQYAIARSSGKDYGKRLEDGDTLDLCGCVVVSTDFIAGLSEATVVIGRLLWKVNEA